MTMPESFVKSTKTSKEKIQYQMNGNSLINYSKDIMSKLMLNKNNTQNFQVKEMHIGFTKMKCKPNQKHI